MKNSIFLTMAVALGLLGGPVLAAEPAQGFAGDNLAVNSAARPDMDDEDDGPDLDDEDDGARAGLPPMRGMDKHFAGRGGADHPRAKDGKGPKEFAGKAGFDGKGMKPAKGRMNGRDARMPPEMIKKMEAKLLEAVASADKDFAAELTSLKESDPGLYHGVSVRLGKALFVSKRVADEELFKNGVKMAKVEIAKAGLLEKYRAARSDSDKKALKSQLRDVLSQEFDLRQAFEEGRVKMVEKELADLKKAVADRKAEKAEMINDKLTEELGEKPRW